MRSCCSPPGCQPPPGGPGPVQDRRQMPPPEPQPEQTQPEQTPQQTRPELTLPLADIRVIDLTVARAGPTCVRQLADWGADVIRVEPPAGAGPGDSTGEGRHGCDFQNLHRNKRSLTLNLKAPEAGEVLMRLVDTSDVLIENMR